VNSRSAEKIVLEHQGSLVHKQYEFSHDNLNDAVFENLFTTVCGSDLRIIVNGDARIVGPRVLGHEVVARVVSPGTRKDFLQGDYVAIGADIPCGICNHCLLNQENLCFEHIALGYQLDGGLSSIMIIPNKFLQNAPIVKITPEVSVEAYALAEPLGCVLHGLEFSNVEKHHRVLIIGGGPIGIMLAKACEAFLGIPLHNISIVESFEGRRGFIRKLGFEVQDRLMESNSDYYTKFDRIFTATSNPEAHKEIFDHVRRGGKINFFGGVPKLSSKLEIDPNFLHYSEVSIEGSHGSCPRHHRRAAELISRDEAFWASLITLKTTLKELPYAIDRLRTGLEIKVAVEFANV